MERVWEKARRLEEKGIPLSHDLFGRLVREEWKTVKEEAAKVCPVVSYEEIQRILSEFKTESPEKVEEASEVSPVRPVEAKVAVSLKTQKLEESSA
jgi:hypothetical protein